MTNLTAKGLPKYDGKPCKECGCVFKYEMKEGNNPGCKERESIYCPTCNMYLGETPMYNDAYGPYYTIITPGVIKG